METWDNILSKKVVFSAKSNEIKAWLGEKFSLSSMRCFACDTGITWCSQRFSNQYNALLIFIMNS